MIYKSEIFEGFNLDLHETNITGETISVHHYASSWMTDKQLRKRKIQLKIKRFLGVRGYLKFLKIKRKMFGISKT